MIDELDPEKAREQLEADAKRITGDDIQEVAGLGKEFQAKLRAVKGRFGRFTSQVKLLFGMIGDYKKGAYRKVPWYTLAMSASAVFYFLNPFDVVPDFIPGVGFVDDALMVSLAVRALRADLKAYCEARGLDLSKYF